MYPALAGLPCKWPIGACLALSLKSASGRLKCQNLVEEEVPSLSDDEVKHLHTLGQRLAAIRSMREAVGNAGSNVYWDFGEKRAKPGRVWLDHVPNVLRRDLERDYDAEEMELARQITNIDKVVSVDVAEKPRCVYLLGPPGSGKSTCLPKAASVLNLSLDNFVSVDGDDLRNCHMGWRRCVEEEPVYGYRDSFQVFKRAQKHWRDKFDTLKVQLTYEALRDRKNVLLCDTKLNKHVLQSLLDQNYELIVVGFVVSQDESDLRNRNRGQKIGRFGDASPAAWNVCMDALKLLTRDDYSDRVVIFDTTDLTDPKVIFSRQGDRQRMENCIAAHAANIKQ